MNCIFNMLGILAIGCHPVHAEYGYGYRAPPPPVVYEQPAPAIYAGPSAAPVIRRTCPHGTTPAGRLGCMGQSDTDRADIQGFDRPIEHGCHGLPETRQFWVNGTDPQGRPTHNLVVQHKVCHDQPGS